MEQQNNLKRELEQLDEYIEHLEKEKKELEKENLKRRILVDELKKQNDK